MTDTPRRPLIELRGIEKFYGDFHALKSIDLDIGEGEFFSLLGPSGCGKTTLLRTIAGFEDTGAGTLRIDGADMAGVPANRRPTNMVFQSYAIFPHMTVAQNVGFGLRRRGDLDTRAREAMIAEALEMVGLAGYGARSAQALSGGQRQRVALARALILKPKVLLLDEPLSALDRKLREHMQVELIRLQRHVGITFILVTHDQEEALVMSDRIAVMFEGRIAQLDAPERLYKRPATRAVAEFIGSMNFLPGRIAARGDTIELDIAGLGNASVDPAQCVEVSEGSTCHVGVRPETMSIRFEGEAPGPGRTAEGTVSEVVYYGDMTYYDVLLDGAERPVRISMRNLVGRPVLDVGTRTAITWDPRSLVLFA